MPHPAIKSNVPKCIVVRLTPGGPERPLPVLDVRVRLVHVRGNVGVGDVSQSSLLGSPRGQWRLAVRLLGVLRVTEDALAKGGSRVDALHALEAAGLGPLQRGPRRAEHVGVSVTVSSYIMFIRIS